MRRAIIVALIPLLLALGISTGLSKWHWGYFFVRPSADRWFSNVAEIRSLGRFQAHGRRTQAQLSAEPIQIPQDVLQGKASPEYPHYYLDERILERLLEALPQANVTPSPTQEMAQAAADLLYHHALPDHPVIADNNPLVFSGMVGEFIDRKGERRYVVAGSVGFVSNDDVFYQELLLDELRVDTPVRSRQTFYYDIAGLEGTEWYHVFPFLAIPLFLIGLPFSLLALVTRYGDRRRRCLNCAHLLDPSNQGVCPECGSPFDIARGQSTSAGGMLGWLKRRWYRGPGIVTILVLAVAIILLTSARSLPAGWSLGESIGRWTVIVFGTTSLMRLVSTLSVARATRSARARFRVRWVSIALVALLVTLSVTTLVANWPLRARWLLSRAAFERALAPGSKLTQGPMRSRWIGLYKVNQVGLFDLNWPGNPKYIGVDSGAFRYRTGFLYSPTLPIDIPAADRDRATVRSLGDGWYLVDVQWRMAGGGVRSIR